MVIKFDCFRLNSLFHTFRWIVRANVHCVQVSTKMVTKLVCAGTCVVTASLIISFVSLQSIVDYLLQVNFFGEIFHNRCITFPVVYLDSLITSLNILEDMLYSSGKCDGMTTIELSWFNEFFGYAFDLLKIVLIDHMEQRGQILYYIL